MRDRADAVRTRRARSAGAETREKRARRTSSEASKRRRSASRTRGGSVASSGEAMVAYFAAVDEATLVEEEEEVGRRTRTRGRDGWRDAAADARGEDWRALPGVLPRVDEEVVRLMTVAKRSRRASDPTATVRWYARRAARRRARERRRSGRDARAGEEDDGGADEMAAMDLNGGDVFDAGFDAPSPAPSPRSGDGAAEEDGLYGLLLRAARDERESATLPSTYSLEEVRGDDARCEDLLEMSREFEREDPRVGALAGGLGAGVAHVLRADDSSAVGYTLTYENRAPDWDQGRAVTVPPRLAHVYIRKEHRGRGLGTGLVANWIKTFALRCAFFAVDSPNDSMLRTLKRVNTAPATTRSGHGASSVHYVATDATV